MFFGFFKKWDLVEEIEIPTIKSAILLATSSFQIFEILKNLMKLTFF